MPLTCVICLDPLSIPVSLPCGHLFCEECINEHISNSPHTVGSRFSCPTCRKSFNTSGDSTQNPIIRRIYFPSTTSAPDEPCGSSPAISPTDIQNSADYLTLLSRVSYLESRIAELKRDRDKLIKDSELQMRFLKQSVDAQRLMKTENAQAKKEAWDARRKYEALKEQVRDQQYGFRRARELAASHRTRTAPNQVTPTPNVLRRARTSSFKRTQGFDWKELVRVASRRP